MEGFISDLSVIAPPAGEGAYGFLDSDGVCRGWVQIIWLDARRLTIHRLWTLAPGRGNGSMMLRTICRLADRYGIEIILRPLPFGRKPYPLKREQLMNWYHRHGFEGTRWRLVRRPEPMQEGGTPDGALPTPVAERSAAPDPQ